MRRAKVSWLAGLAGVLVLAMVLSRGEAAPARGLHSFSGIYASGELAKGATAESERTPILLTVRPDGNGAVSLELLFDDNGINTSFTMNGTYTVSQDGRILANFPHTDGQSSLTLNGHLVNRDQDVAYGLVLRFGTAPQMRMAGTLLGQ